MPRAVEIWPVGLTMQEINARLSPWVCTNRLNYGQISPLPLGVCKDRGSRLVPDFVLKHKQRTLFLRFQRKGGKTADLYVV